MSVTKSTDAEVYAVLKNYECATIMLRCWSRPDHVGTEHARTRYCGEILIHSSFGSWGNTGTACGKPFKLFLLDADFGYVFTKFMGTKLQVWDGEASVASLRRRVLEWRRSREIPSAAGRELLDAIDSYSSELESSSHEFVECVYRIADDLGLPSIRSLLSEPWELTETQPDPQAVGFWRELWPEFCTALRAETAAEVKECMA